MITETVLCALMSAVCAFYARSTLRAGAPIYTAFYAAMFATFVTLAVAFYNL